MYEKKRKEWADRTGISEAQILNWVKIADLLRIRGMQEEYVNLLMMIGSDTLPKLSNEVPDNLYDRIKAENGKRKSAGRLPTLDMVEEWIRHAKSLQKVVEY